MAFRQVLYLSRYQDDKRGLQSRFQSMIAGYRHFNRYRCSILDDDWEVLHVYTFHVMQRETDTEENNRNTKITVRKQKTNKKNQCSNDFTEGLVF